MAVARPLRAARYGIESRQLLTNNKFELVESGAPTGVGIWHAKVLVG